MKDELGEYFPDLPHGFFARPNCDAELDGFERATAEFAAEEELNRDLAASEPTDLKVGSPPNTNQTPAASGAEPPTIALPNEDDVPF